MVKIVTKRRIFKLSISREIVDREFWNKEFYNEYRREKWDSEWDINALNKVIDHLKGLVKDARKQNHSDDLKLGTTNEKLKKGIIIKEENYINYPDIQEWKDGMKAIEKDKQKEKTGEK